MFWMKAQGFKVKRIAVNPGGRLSLQSHKHRGEHWTVVTGIATVTVGDKRARSFAFAIHRYPQG